MSKINKIFRWLFILADLSESAGKVKAYNKAFEVVEKLDPKNIRLLIEIGTLCVDDYTDVLEKTGRVVEKESQTLAEEINKFASQIRDYAEKSRVAQSSGDLKQTLDYLKRALSQIEKEEHKITKMMKIYAEVNLRKLREKYG